MSYLGVELGTPSVYETFFNYQRMQILEVHLI